jgi:hypothetical protein
MDANYRALQLRVYDAIKWFDLAGHTFNNLQAEFRVSGLSREGGAGVVSREFLSVFTIVFNYPERCVAFVRKPQLASDSTGRSDSARFIG